MLNAQQPNTIQQYCGKIVAKHDCLRVLENSVERVDLYMIPKQFVQ